MNKDILLIAFYNPKALGVQYISQSLKKSGYAPHVLFLKEYNSKKPCEVSDTELDLLKRLIDKIDPGFIALSVMSSLYLREIVKVNSFIRKISHCPIIWGGVFCTLFPEKSLDHADFVIRGEGEEAIVELIEALSSNKDLSDIQNLAYGKTAKRRQSCQTADTGPGPAWLSESAKIMFILSASKIVEKIRQLIR